MCIGALVYWAVGFALTFGDSFGRIVGTSYFFFYSMPGLKFFFVVFLKITKHSLASNGVRYSNYDNICILHILLLKILKKLYSFFFSLQALKMVFPICVCRYSCNFGIWILSRTMQFHSLYRLQYYDYWVYLPNYCPLGMASRRMVEYHGIS